jgi:hypothetical protein
MKKTAGVSGKKFTGETALAPEDSLLLIDVSSLAITITDIVDRCDNIVKYLLFVSRHLPGLLAGSWEDGADVPPFRRRGNVGR